MAIINKKVFNKSYMLEFRKGEEIENIFTFSIPPKGEDFDFGQRVVEIKTCGGSIIDNYGNDTVKITLQGTTGNEDKKFIYRGKFPPLYLNGEAEIYELQKIIQEWNSVDKITEERSIYLYDLSKMNALEIATLNVRPNRNWWKVFIKDLKVKRSDTDPHKFNYTIEMISVLEDKKIKGLYESEKLEEITDKFNNAIKITQSVFDYTEMAASLTEELLNQCSKVSNDWKYFNNLDTKGKVLSVFKGVDGTSKIFVRNVNDTFYNSSKSCLSVAKQFWSVILGKEFDAQKKSKTQITNIFIVSFNSLGGTFVRQQNVEYSKKLIKPIEPTKIDYNFKAWFKDDKFKEEYDFSKEVVESFTLFAKWELSVATVVFNSKNGSFVNSKKVAVGSLCDKPIEPKKKGCIFAFWCTDFDCTNKFDFNTPITTNLTLYAKWTDVITVTFETGGGSEIEEQYVNIGGLVVYPGVSEKENYLFTFWSKKGVVSPFDFSKQVDSDVRLVANYIRISNSIIFDSRGGSDVEKQYVKIGQLAKEPPEPTKDTFDFVYWAKDDSATNKFLFDKEVIQKDTVLFARWNIKVFVVKFNSTGGDKVDEQKIEYGSKCVFPIIPKKKDNIFSMWQIKKIVDEEDVYEEFDFNLPITENIELFAKWEKKV